MSTYRGLSQLLRIDRIGNNVRHFRRTRNALSKRMLAQQKRQAEAK